MTQKENYDFLLSTLSCDQWKCIGLKRRSGVVVALFSIYSSNSLGIGELPDLKLMVDWCNAASMSILQLLPLNDVGFTFRPYDAQSSFALDPMYLNLENLHQIDIKSFLKEIKALKEKFPVGVRNVNYGIKSAKLEILKKIFSKIENHLSVDFQAYIRQNQFWLQDYALFKIIKELNQSRPWEEWPVELKNRIDSGLRSVEKTQTKSLMFHMWLQWQLCKQFQDVKRYANARGVYIMGDLPFLVCRDSADVWAHQDYFKLSLAAGAPPDMLYSKGQRWGMPPYNWDTIAKHNYDYIIQKLKTTQNFYDLFRIDHVVGIFRVWSISLSEPFENAGANGVFDPPNEKLWEGHGREILSTIVKNTSMLACAEDLGTVPQCCVEVLGECGIPGIDVQRWMRDWGKTFEFKSFNEYRKNCVATISTHDMSSFCAWWEFEAGTVDSHLFERKCREKNISFENVKNELFWLEKSAHDRLRWSQTIVNKDILLKTLGASEQNAGDLISLYLGSFDERARFLKFLQINESPDAAYSALLVKKTLQAIAQTSSIFAIQLLQDWLSLDSILDSDIWEYRINFPGTISDKNWSLVMPVSLEDLLALPVNNVIKGINAESDRI